MQTCEEILLSLLDDFRQFFLSQVLKHLKSPALAHILFNVVSPHIQKGLIALERGLGSTSTLCHSVENPGSGSRALCSVFEAVLVLAPARAVTDELASH